MSAAVKTRLVYDLQTCGRCGGSGHYSYCEMYGTTCFQCRGVGKVYSRAGVRAKAAVDAFIVATFSKPVESLVVGDLVRIDGGVRRVTTAPATSGSSFGSHNAETGEMTWTHYIDVVLSPLRGDGYATHGFAPASTVTLAPVGADWQRVVAFARTLKKGVSVVETPAK